MTEKITGILLYVLALVLLGLMVLSSCATPNPKKQKKHWDKFVYYGGKVDTVERTIRITDTIKGKDGRDSIIYRDIEVKCPEPKIEYKDRWHIRRLDRQTEDSLKHVEKMAKYRHAFVEDSLSKIIKIERQKSKQSASDARQAKYEKSGGWSNPVIWIIIALMAIVSIYLIKTQ
jgi:hypothetical protein